MLLTLAAGGDLRHVSSSAMRSPRAAGGGRWKSAFGTARTSPGTSPSRPDRPTRALESRPQPPTEMALPGPAASVGRGLGPTCSASWAVSWIHGRMGYMYTTRTDIRRHAVPRVEWAGGRMIELVRFEVLMASPRAGRRDPPLARAAARGRAASGDQASAGPASLRCCRRIRGGISSVWSGGRSTRSRSAPRRSWGVSRGERYAGDARTAALAAVVAAATRWLVRFSVAAGIGETALAGARARVLGGGGGGLVLHIVVTTSSTSVCARLGATRAADAGRSIPITMPGVRAPIPISTAVTL